MFHCSGSKKFFLPEIKCPRNLFGFRFSAPPMRKSKSWRTRFHRGQNISPLPVSTDKPCSSLSCIKTVILPLFAFWGWGFVTAFFSFKILSGGMIYRTVNIVLKEFLRKYLFGMGYTWVLFWCVRLFLWKLYCILIRFILPFSFLHCALLIW